MHLRTDSPIHRSTDQPALLSAAELAALGDLMFVARRMVAGLYAGRHRSPRRGHSTEFYDYRGYLPGDEPRRVDWKAFGRTDRLYVRRFRHDADLAMHLLVDRSASMDFASVDAGRGGWRRRDKPPATKFTCARQLAAALAYVAVQQGDRVSLTWLDRRATPAMGLGGSSEHLRELIAALESAEPGGPTDPGRALAEAHAAITGGRSATRTGALAIIISDLLDPAADWLAGLAPLLHDRFDIAAIQVLSPQELGLRGMADRRLIDSETGRSLPTAPALVADRYRAEMAEHIARLQRGLRRHGADHHLITTDQPPVQALRSYLASRAGR